jgi:DNA-binding response OmpR family regulator
LFQRRGTPRSELRVAVAAVKILVVEDDPKLARLLRRVLAEEGHVVDVCVNGDEALVQGRSGVYGLVLLDWMIPGVDGLSVCRELRRSGSQVPILMLTARCELSERVLAINAGADDYMAKPFEIDELLARLTALLRRSIGQQVISLGELEVDRLDRNATLAVKRLKLSAREFDVLAYLACRANQPVERSDLLAHVWPTQFDSGSNVVDVHINRLREKLGSFAWMIETIRGRGYMLRSEPST